MKSFLNKIIWIIPFFLTNTFLIGQEGKFTVDLYLDLNDKGFSSNSRLYTPFEDGFVFVANNWQYGRELWLGGPDATDFKLLKDITFGYGSTELLNLVPFKNKIYFGATQISSLTTGQTLWETDGTEAGTKIVATLPILQGARLNNLVATDTHLFFSLATEGIGAELWVSDGTAEGTRLVKDLFEGPQGADIQSVTVFGNSIIFSAESQAGQQLWVSDGTEAGTFSLTNKVFGINIKGVANEKVFFIIGDDEHGAEPWATDGTVEGTKMLTDIYEGPRSSDARNFKILKNRAYFVADEFFLSSDLWVSDGTPEGTEKCIDLSEDDRSNIHQLSILNDTLLLFAGLEKMYQADGKNPPELLSENYPISMSSSGDRIFFINYIESAQRLFTYSPTEGISFLQIINGAELKVFGTPKGYLLLEGDGISSRLWGVDKTGKELQLLRNFSDRGFSLVAESLNAFEEYIIFNGFSSNTGNEPWISDGTLAGTFLLNDINNSTESISVKNLTSIGNKLFINLNTDNGFGGLYATDGTKAQTFRLSETPSKVVAFQDNAYFIKGGNNGQNEIWRSDGTPEGTSFIMQASNLHTLFAAENQIFVSSNTELWVTDGTPNNSTLVKKIAMGQLTTYGSYTTLGNQLYFYANDGTHGDELWVSNGEPEGTFMVRELYPGTAGANITGLMTFKNAVYFTGDTNGPARQLWKSKGTRDSTFQVTGFTSSFGNEKINSLIASNNQLYFELGNNLWAYDGNTQQTQLIVSNQKIERISATDTHLYYLDEGGTLWASSLQNINFSKVIDKVAQRDMSSVKNLLFFNKSALFLGEELWVTNGTAAGTYLTQDINLESRDAIPTSITYHNNQLVFAAQSSQYGRELFEIILDQDEDGFIFTEDCNDENSAVYPGAEEIANNRIDEDCNGQDLIITNVEEALLPYLTVFPNPATTYLNLQFPESYSGTIELFNVTKQMVLNQDFDGSNLSLNVGNLVSGMYFLKVNTVEGAVIKNVVIR